MNDQKSSLTKKINRRFFGNFGTFLNRIFSRKNLVIFIGKNGVSLISIHKNKAINVEYVDLDKQNDLQNYKVFLEKYAKYNIIFLLDNPEVNLSNRNIPVLHNILKVNPVEKYILDKLDPSEIIAYNVCSTSGIENWETCIAKTPYTSPYNILLEYVINNGCKLSGTYFLNLEFQPIIDSILKNKDPDGDYSEYLQIFLCITKTSNIRICVRHKKNLLEESTIEYPQNKSPEYVKGVIETELNDKIIAFKEYASEKNLEISVIILCSNNFKNIVTDLRFEDCKKMIIAGSEDFFPKKIITRDLNLYPAKNSNFVDTALVSLFYKTKSYLAYNDQLKAISRLERINKVIFKPFLLAIILLIGNIIWLKLESLNLKNKTANLNDQYYLILEEYKKIKNNHPNIVHIGKLAEFYSFEKLLSEKSPLGFDMIEKILQLTKGPNIEFVKINLNLSSKARDVHLTNSDVSIDLILNYRDDFKGYELSIKNNPDQIKEINTYVDSLKKEFQGFDIESIIDTKNSTIYSNYYTIPISIKIRAVDNDFSN